MSKKKIEAIMGLSDEDKLLVQKSLPLFALWRSNLTLAEFKILDTYLSRIDSHNPDKRYIRFEKGELEHILGVKKINQADLKERLKHLMGNVVEVADKDDSKGFKLITLFEEAVAEQDECGIWQVNLECTQKAMKYIFNIENIGYLRYKLRCITNITSRYSYILFNYLEYNRYRKNWNIDLNELKQLLDCSNIETYKQFKEFNKQVLKRVQKELCEKTECKFEYKPVKKGRTVVAIRFTVQTLKDVTKTAIAEKNVTENTTKIDLIPMAKQILQIDDEIQAQKFIKLCQVKMQLSIQKGTKIRSQTDYLMKIMQNSIDEFRKMQEEEEKRARHKEENKQSYDINEFEKYAINYQEYKKVQEDIEPPTSNIINKDEIIQETTDMPLDEADNATTIEKTIIRKSEIPSELWERLSKIPNDSIEYIDDTQ